MKKKVPAYNGSILHILFGFEGRCSRHDFWLKYFLPLCILIGILIYAVANAEPQPETVESDSVIGMIIAIVVKILSVWTFVAVGKKRCQDMDRSPWFLLFWLLPIANLYVLAVLAFRGGTSAPNQYGHPAKNYI
ncbi:MAG: DUF805 domain-containing protein [Pseudodesulfovibrio sp.]